MIEIRDEKTVRELIRLTLISGVGPITTQALLDHFGSADKVMRASIQSLKEVEGVGPKLAAKIASGRDEYDPEVELAECRQHDTQPVARGSEFYPPPLEDIPDPPPLIYVRGTYLAADRNAVAIVGSRKSTSYGVRIAERLATSLARVGLTVVSGLARGIDAAAHRGALKAGGRTLAVLANGLSAIYPPEHAKLAEEIAENGAVISEMPMRHLRRQNRRFSAEARSGHCPARSGLNRDPGPVSDSRAESVEARSGHPPARSGHRRRCISAANSVC